MDSAGTPDRIPWCGPAPDPGEILSSWNFDPLLIVALMAALICGTLYAENRRVFFMAWTALVLAFVSPLCAMTTALFSARAFHHLLLISIAAPLLALALPLHRLAIGRLSAPLASLITAAALMLWHIPEIYSAAWDSTWIYWLMQFVLVLPAWVFWAAVFSRAGQDAGHVLVNASLVGALAGVMGLIGAVLTFSSRLLYIEHIAGALAWGLEPLADQQTAGLIMWVPGLVPLAMVSAILARRAWQQGEAA